MSTPWGRQGLCDTKPLPIDAGREGRPTLKTRLDSLNCHHCVGSTSCPVLCTLCREFASVDADWPSQICQVWVKGKGDNTCGFLFVGMLCKFLQITEREGRRAVATFTASKKLQARVRATTSNTHLFV